MSLTLDKEIFDLKVEIEGYQEKLNDPSKLVDGETRSEVVQIFNTSRAYLTELTKQKTVLLQSPPAGKYQFPMMYDVRISKLILCAIFFSLYILIVFPFLPVCWYCLL